ncbi:sigma 54 modulation/S30EA ribosomal C-terminal domain-containing protein [Fictibacillus solisalsi]|uniref:sigma 54 modulation/S30EA ribosomal C-terminal domain-containing protein n=1 Tax=Fictibacillus solisalsi TaxID=459525 RepID=UPI000B7E2E0C
MKVKELLLIPMNGDKAIDQMNQQGHSFFVFCDEKTDQVCVACKIKNEAYGILAANTE